MDKTIRDDIEKEYAYAEKEWGTDFDDHNTINDWAAYVAMYAGQAAKINTPPDEQYKQMVKVAVVVQGALEAFKRNEGFAPRHYD